MICVEREAEEEEEEEEEKEEQAVWVDISPTLAKKNNNTVHMSTKMTPNNASLKI